MRGGRTEQEIENKEDRRAVKRGGEVCEVDSNESRKKMVRTEGARSGEVKIDSVGGMRGEMRKG